MSVESDGIPFILTADQLADDFLAVAKLAGVELNASALLIEKLPAPHVPPTRLPTGRMAVYVFARGTEVLKVGKVGAKSQARDTSQHYNAGSALSTLAASILAESGRHGLTEADMARAGQWIKQNVDRVNLLIDEKVGIRLLTLLEAFLQCRLNPRYEGFKSQSTSLS